MEEKERRERNPKSCYWYEQCQCEKVCQYYTPLEDEEMDYDEDEVRAEYRRAFFEYIGIESYADGIAADAGGEDKADGDGNEEDVEDEEMEEEDE